jgi:SAM-dependent MidA family methyltransferase
MSVSDLQQLISERIQREGPIPFVEYMRMALYEPGYGYYMTGAAKMGWEADYFTSTDVSSLFAHCMGRQLFAMWEKLKRPAHFIVLEQGAGRGHLAEGVRTWAQKEAPEFYEVLDYRDEDIRGGEDAVERRPPIQGREQGERARAEQGERARAEQAPPLPYTNEMPISHDHVEEVQPEYSRGDREQGRGQAPPLPYTNEMPISHDHVEEVQPKYSRGDPRGRPVYARDRPIHALVVLSNELIDAFPVHIVEKRGEQLYEVFVDVQQDGRFCEVLDEPSTPEVDGYLDEYKIPWRTFDEGWRAEINLDALLWIQRTAGLMRHGFILTIDYGDKAKALYTAWRKRGTLLCYYKHQANERPLLHPGEQDITAHVNFSTLINEGRRLGMRLHTFTTQRHWLLSMGIEEELEQRRVTDFAEAETARATDRGQVALLKWRDLRQRAAVLTDPDGMGNFKVLIMRR